jgi:hypothetical protein
MGKRLVVSVCGLMGRFASKALVTRGRKESGGIVMV